MNRSKKFKVIIALGAVFLIISLGFVSYPTFSNFINQLNNNATIKDYSEMVSNLSTADESDYLSEANDYNRRLRELGDGEKDEITAEYEDILNINDGVMGSVEIPKIDVKLPIYHGTDEKDLSVGAGHMSDTSLPVGGINTHSVISAHTAYPGKVFFDDLPDLEEGDIFYIKVLSQTLAYQVSDINIVDPSDVSKLRIIDGKDCVSLLTCYPYAVNTHRLIVTGTRIFEEVETPIVIEEEHQTEGYSVWITVGVVVFVLTGIVIVLLLLIKKKYKKQ